MTNVMAELNASRKHEIYLMSSVSAQWWKLLHQKDGENTGDSAESRMNASDNYEVDPMSG